MRLSAAQSSVACVVPLSGRALQITDYSFKNVRGRCGFGRRGCEGVEEEKEIE